MPRLSIQHWIKMGEMPFFSKRKPGPNFFVFTMSVVYRKQFEIIEPIILINIINIFSRKSIAPCCVWISNGLALTMLMKWSHASG